jgi:hypothetical protein
VLHDFPVAVTLNGERYIVICRDLPTAVFFYGYPNVPPGTKCYDAQTAAERMAEFVQIQTWMLNLLARAAVDPILTLESVHRLGEGALEGVCGYGHAVGWFTDEDLERQAAQEGGIGAATRAYQQSLGALAEEVLPAPTTPVRLFREQHMPYVRQIAPNIRDKIAMLARRCHVRPSVIWLSPISETMVDYRILLDSKAPAAGTELTGDDALIGWAD